MHKRLWIISQYIIICLAISILLSLGTWQIFRLQWKNKLIYNITTENNKLQALPEKPKLFAKYLITGTIQNNKIIKLVNYRNGALGYDIIATIKLANNKNILVNLGWANPQQTLDLSKNITNKTIIITTYDRKNLFIHNNLIENRWYYIIKTDAEKYFNKKLEDYMAILIDKHEQLKHAIVIEKISNNHLQYSITWYSLAIIVLIITKFKYKQLKQIK